MELFCYFPTIWGSYSRSDFHESKRTIMHLKLSSPAPDILAQLISQRSLILRIIADYYCVWAAVSNQRLQQWLNSNGHSLLLHKTWTDAWLNRCCNTRELATCPVIVFAFSFFVCFPRIPHSNAWIMFPPPPFQTNDEAITLVSAHSTCDRIPAPAIIY